MTTVAVVGGGIVGASAAFHLAAAGVATTLVDSEAIGRATSAGAGIIAPGTSSRPLPPFFELAKPAVAYYPDLVAKLGELGIPNSGYEVCGKLIVADTEERAAELPGRLAMIRQRHADGMPNLGNVSEITQTEARELLPTLGPILAAAHIPDAARVDGAVLRDALTRGAEQLGARVVRGNAEVVIKGDRAVAVQISDVRINIDAVVVANGAWINHLLEPTGFELPIAPQKWQILHIDMPGTDTSAWPILDWSGSQYQLSFGPNRVVCGATREFNSGYDTRVTPAGVKEVLDEQLRLTPGLANGTIVEVRVGLRPYSADGVPFIGRLPEFNNVIVSCGHGPSGLQLGPYSGFLAAELAQGNPSPINLTNFRLDRSIQSPEVSA